MGLVGLTAAVTAMVGGLLWDISWDASIGVDSFWSPPHMATNFGALAAGVFGLVLASQARRQASNSREGGGVSSGQARRQTFGAGLVVWGAVCMVGFLIVDDWWGRSYGLHAERWSPPEILFTTAAAAILAGAVIAAAASSGRAGLATAWLVGLAIAFTVAAMTPYSMPNLHRTATFYLVSALMFPFLLAWAARCAAGQWSATSAAASYTLFVCALIWILPRFAARPEIGPIYEPVEALIPPRFPLLLLFPAVAIDVSARRLGSEVARVVACAASFAIIFIAAQWTFASFLLSPASDNWFFAGGGRHWPFYLQIGTERTAFWGLDADALSLFAVLGVTMLAALGTAAGLSLGRWTRGEVS